MRPIQRFSTFKVLLVFGLLILVCAIGSVLASPFPPTLKASAVAVPEKNAADAAERIFKQGGNAA